MRLAPLPSASSLFSVAKFKFSTISEMPSKEPEPENEEPGLNHEHFKMTKKKHPLQIPKTWQNPMQNHIWEEEEILELMKSLPTHTPVTFSDKFMHFLVKTVLYNGFNWITGFDRTNPSARSCQWRLIILESVAGCPGMVAAGMRHFRSLRTLQRDHGWIHTLLEEAENERMHLLVCLKMFDTGYFTRFMVVAAQYLMVGFLSVIYVVHPKSLHRFVGYLEETASQTYFDLIQCTSTPGTHLHKDWKDLPAPELAIRYWRMDEDSMWIDVLKNLFADETNHRDVNHTFATMKDDDPNPFVEKHLKDAAKAWRLDKEQQTGKKN
eukprot:CAMPEP_0197517084 /NCGR_PEP_ID=MMETSP1318-20131121/2046_1 /TAXON_ID=552666 /ORGANISM="Partenskyella glossopodia, Strain RCC365" /LENGTH=322 /DNA_ID=CAMNT_0043066353 /DNA_START=138 /DNA_END=1106 /DNA_ORIENTATION=-